MDEKQPMFNHPYVGITSLPMDCFKGMSYLIVGETGVGKSAFCSSLGAENCKSSSQAAGVSLDSISYSVLGGNIVDTIGLGDVSVFTKQAIALRNLGKLASQNSEGFNAIILAKHARTTEKDIQNLQMVRCLYGDNIPIICLVTKEDHMWPDDKCECKDEDFMDDHMNKDHLSNHKFRTTISLNMPGVDYFTDPRKLKLISKEQMEMWKESIEICAKQIRAVTGMRHKHTQKSLFSTVQWLLYRVFNWTSGVLKRWIESLVNVGLSEEDAASLAQEFLVTTTGPLYDISTAATNIINKMMSPSC